MKLILRLSSLLCLLTAPAVAKVVQVSVAPSDIYRGTISSRIPLEQYGTPAVRLLNPVYSPATRLPEGAKAGSADQIGVYPGMELKKAFALVQVPAYRQSAQGGYEVLSSYSLDVQEPAAEPGGANPSRLAKTAAANSPLSTGTWYKIAVPDRGIYKVDYDFLQKLGISGNISSGNIRLVGNGGALLSENNAVPRPLDLSENAIWMNDGGDGSFGSGDFFAFYCPGPTRWDKDSINQRFIHNKHIYADSSYYFVSVGAGAGQRIETAPATGGATTSVTSFNDYVAHEEDLYNPGKFGKEWWGERFGMTSAALPERSFSFPLGAEVGSIGLRLSVASRADVAGNQMNVWLNDNPIQNYIFNAVRLEDDNNPVDAEYTDVQLPVSGATANFRIAYTSNAEAIGYLNYIELNWRRPLAFVGKSFGFRDWNSVAPGAVAAYQLSGADGSTQVWDVTDPTRPQRMNGSLNGSTYSFTQSASYLHEFLAVDGKTFGTPFSRGKVANQNLHAADAPQLVIVTHPDWLEAAERLADRHRNLDGMRVLVATTSQVYNEFSSGAQDISGIRDMMRYYYLQAGADTSRMPRYLLLFGDASYDYKNRLGTNSNYVPTYESGEAVSVDVSYTVDDFFGFLDDNENMSDIRIVNTLELGIGRIPVGSLKEANEAVAKIEAYTSPASLGPWRTMNTYIGDNEDNAGQHLQDAEDIASVVNRNNPYTNTSKVYLDNLNFVSTPSGYRCPDANKAINDQIFKGTFLLNYTGHGSTTTLAHERIMTNDDFGKWTNLNKLPFMVTATCDYARYDNPALVSNGEKMILKANGGTIAMLTTTGPVYASVNRDINQQYLQAQYTKRGDGWPTFGDAMREGKNVTFSKAFRDEFTLINFYRFTLLGDPAIQPAFPRYLVHTDSIIDMSTGLVTDSMRALGKYALTGHVSTKDGAVIDTFNGRAHITIYDKPRLVRLKAKETGRDIQYYLRDNVIFKGVATVTNGTFSCSFIAPKDINYDFGKARVSYYAENGVTDAEGMDTSVTAGGYNDNAPSDNVGPDVKPYIGDTLFRDGGITGPNTLLYVKLYDENGINTAGNGVGHDLTAVLDGDEEHPINLNDYFVPEANTYQHGHVSYPVDGLADGVHKFWVKAWDVYNNSGTGEVNFVVKNGKVMEIINLINYPNPFTETTRMFFEHNHPAEALKVQIMIYDMAGRQVRHIETSFTPGGSHSNEIGWDGNSDSGARLPSGVYPCRMILSTESGVKGTAYQKMVIVR
jgi:hypothetical protein